MTADERDSTVEALKEIRGELAEIASEVREGRGETRENGRRIDGVVSRVDGIADDLVDVRVASALAATNDMEQQKQMRKDAEERHAFMKRYEKDAATVRQMDAVLRFFRKGRAPAARVALMLVASAGVGGGIVKLLEALLTH